MEIKKAIFPAAGFGTRFLPATKAIPKEMLPVVDKPIIQYGVEEAVMSGLDEIIIITGMGKNSIEDHFDVSRDLESILKKRKKTALLKAIRQLTDVHYSYTRQKTPLGLGHAILCVKRLVGNEPFAVFLGDDIIESKTPVMGQMLKVFKRYRSPVIAVQGVGEKETHMYGIIKGTKIKNRIYKVKDLVEKPHINPPSNLAIIGRYILTPDIFKALELTRPGKGGEIQLTDAIRRLLKHRDVYACEFEGERFDAGDKAGYIKANMALGLKRRELKGELKTFIKNLAL